MWRYQLRGCLKMLLSVVGVMIVLLPVAVANVFAFPFATEKELYLYSPSSQATIKRELTLTDVLFLQGESGRVTDVLSAVLEKYSATVLFQEKGEGYTSYYCYSTKLNRSIVLDGKNINLHIVEYDDGLRVGTPIIFGGY